MIIETMEEYKKYIELQKKFEEEIVRIGKILQGSNNYFEIGECDENSIQYSFEGKYSYADKEWDSFPSILLFKSEEEIITWDNERKEKERLKKEEENKKKLEEQKAIQEKSDRTTYERLKKKFENE